jgi:hypothetical protein
MFIYGIPSICSGQREGESHSRIALNSPRFAGFASDLISPFNIPGGMPAGGDPIV